VTPVLILIITAVLVVGLIGWGLWRNAAANATSRRTLQAAWPIQYFIASGKRAAPPTAERPAVPPESKTFAFFDNDATNRRPAELTDDKTGKFYNPSKTDDPDRTGQIRTGGN
jgi:hypothetical protein